MTTNRGVKLWPLVRSSDVLARYLHGSMLHIKEGNKSGASKGMRGRSKRKTLKPPVGGWTGRE